MGFWGLRGDFRLVKTDCRDDPALGMWQICCSVGRCPIAARIGEQAQGWETVCLTQLTVGTEFSKSLSSISDA